jgi:serine/threonine-protein kinase HipA
MTETTIVDVFHAHPQGDRRVGRLYAHRRRGTQSATFNYAEDWIGSPGAYELDPGLPLVTGQQQTSVGRNIFGAFMDSAPDRWGRRLITRNEKRRVEREGGTPRSLGDMELLLGVRDDVRQGALRYRTPGSSTWLSDERSGVPHLLELGRLLGAADRMERETADDDDLRILLRAGSSLGGARPKAHVLDAEGRLAMAKFPSPSSDEWDVMAWERVAFDLAERSGIRVPDSRLHRVDGTNVLIVARFDRVRERRLAYASAMTMLEGVDGEARSYLEVAEAIEERSAQPVADLHELWRRIAFSILVSNTDDHLRNHGFVRDVDDPGWRLSPAFDMNPNPIDPGELATSIDASNHAADVVLLLGVADWFRLGEEAARRVLGEVERATSRWREAAQRAGLSTEQIEFMVPAFEHEQRQRARDESNVR